MGTTPVIKPAASARVDVADVQGLVRFGYAKLTEARYLLLQVRDAAAARKWCGDVNVGTAEYQATAPKTALHIAFSAPGLRELGVSAEVITGFSAEFQSGLARDPSRSRRLGDTGGNAPASWDWGSPDTEPHVLVMLFAQAGRLAEYSAQVQNEEFRATFTVIHDLETSNLDGYEPFGFQDGISQPQLDWERKHDPSGDKVTYSNVVALGEFVLGYPNEYGKYTERPLLDASAPGTGVLPFAEDQPEKRDLGRNGTYLVIRQLEQDVRGFWQWVERAAKENGIDRDTLAAAMVGRTTEGQPLVGLSKEAIPGVDDKPNEAPNRFTFDSDPEGVRCPFGSHIRRANPRNVDLPGRPGWLLPRLLRMLSLTRRIFREDITATTRFHRVLRRGREYGPALTVEQALRPSAGDDSRRGIHFICINANILRQFEFVQNAWMMGTKFDGLSEESDPLLGNRAAVGSCPYTGNFSLPREGAPPREIGGLPEFITVRGGGYFFLPGLRALQYISGSTTSSRKGI